MSKIDINNVKSKLKSIMEEVFEREIVNEAQSTVTIPEWDSLNHINLVFELESEFDVSFTPEEITLLYSNNEKIVEILLSKL